MSGKFFLDTNIFVDSFDLSSPKKAAQATRLIRKGIGTNSRMVNYQVVQEFFNVALRRFAKPMSNTDAEQYLATTFRPLLAVHSSPAFYGEALRILASFRWLGMTHSLWLRRSKVSVTFSTVKSFRMGSILEA